MYEILLTIHILAVIAAFGPTLAYMSINRAAARSETARGVIAAIPATLHRRISFPAIVVATLAGIALVGETGYLFSATWVSASFAVVFLAVAVSRFMLTPALDRYAKLLATEGASADEVRVAKSTASIGTAFLHVALVVLLLLMIWKPGN